MRQSASELALVAVTLAAALTLLIGAFTVRLLIIQYLNILIIIIIISLLGLGGETTDAHLRISCLHGVGWSWRSVNVVVRIVDRGATRSLQIASRAQSRRLVNERILVLNVHGVHVYVLVGHPGQVLQVAHVGGRTHEELLLLSGKPTAISILLLLHLHIAVFVLAMRDGVVEALGAVPGLFCIGRRARRALGTWSVRKLQMSVLALVLPTRYSLHV